MSYRRDSLDYTNRGAASETRIIDIIQERGSDSDQTVIIFNFRPSATIAPARSGQIIVELSVPGHKILRVAPEHFIFNTAKGMVCRNERELAEFATSRTGSKLSAIKKWWRNLMTGRILTVIKGLVPDPRNNSLARFILEENLSSLHGYYIAIVLDSLPEVAIFHFGIPPSRRLYVSSSAKFIK